MENPSAGLGVALQTFAQFGSKDEVLNLLLTWPKKDDLTVMADVFFRPHFREAQRDPRFMKIDTRV